ncbi:MAG: hypothetical protein ACPF8V_06220 [Luteibaculum sp.]
MIKVDERDNYALLKCSFGEWSAEFISALRKNIIANSPDVLADIASLDPASFNKKVGDQLTEMTSNANVVFIAGDHYDHYHELELDALNFTPRSEEAVDMLFMIKMEKELGGEDFEI